MQRILNEAAQIMNASSQLYREMAASAFRLVAPRKARSGRSS